MVYSKVMNELFRTLFHRGERNAPRVKRPILREFLQTDVFEIDAFETGAFEIICIYITLLIKNIIKYIYYIIFTRAYKKYIFQIKFF